MYSECLSPTAAGGPTATGAGAGPGPTTAGPKITNGTPGPAATSTKSSGAVPTAVPRVQGGVIVGLVGAAALWM